MQNPLDPIKKNRKNSILFKLGKRYLIKHTSSITSEQDKDYRIKSGQRKAIKRLRRKVYFLAAIIGATFVIFAVVPYHFFNFFGVQKFDLFGKQTSFELYYMLYILLLLPPEIWLLNIINMRAVKKMCLILGSPSGNHEDYEEQIAILTEAGLEMSPQYLKVYDINPYIGMSKFAYYGVYLINKVKAALSNFIAKLLVRRFLGRYALKVVTDLAGVPIYAFWDAYASHFVLKEAEIRIIASSAITDFLKKIDDDELRSVKEKLPLIIHFIAQEKRQYNFAIYAFIKKLVERLPDLDLSLKHAVYVDDIMGSDIEKNKLLGKLIVFGMMVDGKLSIKERLTLLKYKDHHWFPFTASEMDNMIKNYIEEGRLMV